MTRKDLADTAQRDPAERTAAAKTFTALVLQDNGNEGDFAQDIFQAAGCHPIYATDLDQALDLLLSAAPDLVLMPLQLKGRNTLPFLTQCKAHVSEPLVVVIATNDQINDAADAMHEGAFDCLFQPFNHVRLTQVIRDGLAQRPPPSDGSSPHVRSTETDPMPYPVDLPPASNLTDSPAPVDRVAQPAPPRPAAKTCSDEIGSVLLGDSPNFRAALQKLESVAQSSAPVFLQGDIGTGKEIFARALHALSGRPKDRFVVVDCAALRPNTVAAEIFGSDKSLSAGASRTKTGAAQRADGGTLYLDEIANLDPKAQNQLVRFLRSGQIHPVGAAQPQEVDVRIVSASSHDPTSLIASGDLLKAFYYQLHVASIPLPSLKERGEDVILLAHHFLTRYSRTENRSFVEFSSEAVDALRHHTWPGNVHELKNVIWNAVLQHDGDTLTRDMLPEGLGAADPFAPATAASDLSSFGSLVGHSLAEIEQLVIEETIRAHDGSIPKAARALGVSPSTIYRKRENWQS